MPVDYSYLRSKKSDMLKSWYVNGFTRKETALADSYFNAVILPLRKEPDLQFGTGGVVVNGEYIIESGIEGRVGGFYEYENAHYRDERVIYCGALIRQWGHFLIESVSRLWYYLDDTQRTNKYIFISNQDHFKNKENICGNYREYLELLGVWDRIEILTVPTAFREVIIPELGYSRKYYYTERYKDMYNLIIHNALTSYTGEMVFDKVFLSRSQFKKAYVNECGLELLDNYFEKNGYQIIYPEKLTLREMIWLLQKAKIVATESGTLTHNFLFCQDGKQVEIIERQTTINEIQANIDIVKLLDTSYIDACYTIYPTSAGWGPFFIAFTKQFSKFTKDRGYDPPDVKYLSDRYLKKSLRKYLKQYKESYGLQWGIEGWQLMYGEAYYEAYLETCNDLGMYLNQNKPLFFVDLFNPHFIKQSIRQLLKKL